MKRLLILVFAAVPLMAQRSEPTYTAVYEKTTSSSAAVTSIQQPAAPKKNVVLLAVQLYCSVACTFTLDAGTAATATASTAIAPTDPSKTEKATALFYTDSNSSAASVPINKYVLAAGQTLPIPFTYDVAGKSNTVLSRSAGQNLTLRTNSISGDVKVTWMWREE